MNMSDVLSNLTFAITESQLLPVEDQGNYLREQIRITRDFLEANPPQKTPNIDGVPLDRFTAQIVLMEKGPVKISGDVDCVHQTVMLLKAAGLGYRDKLL